MRLAFNTEIVRSITHSWTRFIAIFAIVALGAGFYAGLRMCAPDMRVTIDRYLDDTAFMDLHLVSTLGFSDADVAAVGDVRGVAAVMPAQVADATATIGDRRATVRIHGLDLEAVRAGAADEAYLNRPTLVTGRWPERSGECVIDRSRFFPSSAQLDESVTLTAGTTALEDTFTRTEFTVVGVIDSSYYLSFTRGYTALGDGTIDRFLFVPQDDFADPGTYTDLFVAVDGAAAPSTFTDAYDDIVEPVAAALEAIAPGRAEARLAEVKQQAQTALDRKRVEYDRASAGAELANALAGFESAQREIDALKRPEWFVLGRDTNLGYASLSADSDRIEAISVVFPFIFFLVAALVALTTMTRMVDEERTLIGTYKALGYGGGRIAAKYLVYAGIASVSGSIGGILVGSQILPRTVWRAYTTMYTAPPASTPIDVPLALIAGLASVGVTLIATLAAVETTLREDPATLMLPRAPKPGKRIFLERVRPLWSRLSFSQKVTARNLFRYKKRLLMTVVGIAGCTALLLTGFGLKNSISDILGKQYGDIYLYDTIVGFGPGTLEAVSGGGAAREDATLGDLLDDPASFSDHLVMYSESVRISRGGVSVGGHLDAPEETARLGRFIDLHTRVGHAPLTLGDSGAVITEKAARKLGAEVGDTVTVEQVDTIGEAIASSAVTLEISGIAEQYVSHYVYVSPALYRRTFGHAPPYNEALGKAAVSGDSEREALSQKLLARSGVTTVQFTDDITGSFDDMLASLDSVVFILILSAGILAFIVLYNLTNINVTERQREIATIKVLGFYDAEVNAYIYRETAALTLLGCALGLLIGIALEAFVITTAEIDIVMFGREIHAMSYVYSAALTLLFAVIVNLAMIPRLRGIDMVESLKSVE